MKKTLILSLFVALFASLSFAQVTIVPTTLSAAVTSTSQKSFVLTAVTGLNSNTYSLAAGTSYLYIDGEYVSVDAISGKTVSVTRGISGSRAMTHASGALVFAGPANFFSTSRPGLLPGGSCTASNSPALPRPDISTQTIFNCLGGLWVQGQIAAVTPYEIQFPDTGAVVYTGVGTGSAGTAPGATTLYCSEINLPFSKNLTGMAVLNGGTAATDKWIYALYDSAGNLLANTATAGTTATGTNVYQKIAFTSTYYAVGPMRYYGCLEGNAGGSSTVTMIKTGMQDTYTTKGQTGTTFGTLPALTVPTTFTTAVGPYWFLY